MHNDLVGVAHDKKVRKKTIFGVGVAIGIGIESNCIDRKKSQTAVFYDFRPRYR